MNTGEYLKSKSTISIGTALEHLLNLQTASGFVPVVSLNVELGDTKYDVHLFTDSISIEEPEDSSISIEEPEDSIQTENNNYEVGYGDNKIQG